MKSRTEIMVVVDTEMCCQMRLTGQLAKLVSAAVVFYFTGSACIKSISEEVQVNCRSSPVISDLWRAPCPHRSSLNHGLLGMRRPTCKNMGNQKYDHYETECNTLHLTLDHHLLRHQFLHRSHPHRP